MFIALITAPAIGTPKWASYKAGIFGAIIATWKYSSEKDNGKPVTPSLKATVNKKKQGDLGDLGEQKKCYTMQILNFKED